MTTSGASWLRRERVLTGLFGPQDHDSSRPRSIIAWWEIRRVPYNVIVGVAGLVSGTIALIAAGVAERRGGEPVGISDGLGFVVLPILFAVGANVFYTSGWVVELVLSRFTRTGLRAFAVTAFIAGLALSVAMAFLPAVLAVGNLLGLLLGVVRPVSPHS